MVSFPSRDKEWLFTTANTPVSEEHKGHTCEVLGRKLPLNDTLNSEGVRDVPGDLKQQRGRITGHTCKRLSHHKQHTRNFSAFWPAPGNLPQWLS